MNVWDITPLLLLLLFGLALGFGAGFIALVVRLSGRRSPVGPVVESTPTVLIREPDTFVPRPGCWLAVKSSNVLAVQAALGLHNPKPCSWLEGLATDPKLFISPPIRGWILVIGSGVPEPSEDVDACFRFVLEVSRKLGRVQLFSSSRILMHHAWVWADGGRIVRAYAWAGRTIWNQGDRTSVERELGMRCYDYMDALARVTFGQPDAISQNVEKVPQLAARWSLDPAGIDERLLEQGQGIAGEPSRRY